jgi:hypothetical protein
MNETKTIRYQLKFRNLDLPFRPFKWKTKGSAWKPFGSAPKALKANFPGNLINVRQLLSCREGNRMRFCADVDITTPLSRMGAYIRKRRRDEIETGHKNFAEYYRGTE